jgi:hypothetical protein
MFKWFSKYIGFSNFTLFMYLFPLAYYALYSKFDEVLRIISGVATILCLASLIFYVFIRYKQIQSGEKLDKSPLWYIILQTFMMITCYVLMGLIFYG